MAIQLKSLIYRRVFSQKRNSLCYFMPLMLWCSPYKITSGSGVMFDGLAHTVPFVASDLDFFKEFEKMGLGVTAKRDPVSFSRAIDNLGKTYEKYSSAVDNFRQQLTWEYVANQHLEIYDRAMREKRGGTFPTN